MSEKLSNISVKEYRECLTKVGCKHTRTTGGHEHWTRSDLNRPITFQTHIDPVPEFIVKNGLRTLNLSRKEFFETMKKKK